MSNTQSLGMLHDSIGADPVTVRDEKLLQNDRRIYQPLHDSVRSLLDPEYVAFHDRYVQYVEPDNVRPWDGSARTRYVWPYTGSPMVKVGEIKDVVLLQGRFRVRTFTPEGQRPSAGWPVLLWFHGGGWACGDIASENDFCSLACRDVECVVVTVDYRLAPESPFPAAVEDAMDALQWLYSQSGSSELGVDTTRIAVGGVSAGANLAAMLTSKAAKELPDITLAFQLLIVPPVDNTATTDSLWSTHPYAPWLTPARMIWYRNMYITDKADNARWEASPIFTPVELLARNPRTWIAIAEQDCLSSEGLVFASKLQEAGVTTEVKIYKGMPHMMMALSGVLQQGAQVMRDAVDALKIAFPQTETATVSTNALPVTTEPRTFQQTISSWYRRILCGAI